MLKIVFFILLICISNSALAGELIRGATIIDLAANAALPYDGTNKKSFAILLEGGTGKCVGKGWIYIPEEMASSSNSYNQIFSIALMAHASGKKIRLHNYATDTCQTADFISVVR